MSVARRGAGLVATAIACAGLTVPIGPPAYAEEGACSEIQADTEDVDEVKAPSVPLEELGIERATELLEREGRAPGEGAGVAVVDSGIADVARVNEQGGLDPKSEFAKSPSPVYFHGTAVAGLIAGQPRPDGGDVGIAPAASLYDVPVYDDVADSDDGALLGLTDAGVIDGLNRIADNPNVGQVPIRIVNVSLALRPSPRLEAAVKRLTKKGIVVVAASGNRPTSEDDPVLGDFATVPEDGEGEDAARVVFPAGYDSVVAATSSVPSGVNALDFIVGNSATDIAAPTSEGVSYSLNGKSCFLPPEAATSWAAAEISGVLALLMSAYDEPTDRTVARLLRTASGGGDVTTRQTGHGVAQPVEALQRPLTFDDNGFPETSETNNTVLKAEAPRPEADVLAETREDAVWWGLAGGGALVVALLLRPVLARRRPER